MTLSLKNLIIEADRCVACGLCLPHCPTYRKTGSEADSPRGRIQLMRAVAQDIIPNNDRFKAHIALCLSCRSCESACPNNVNYGALVDTARSTFMPQKNVWFSLAKPFLRHRNLQYGINGALWLLQQCKLRGLLQLVIPAAKRLPDMQKPIVWQTFYPAKNGVENAGNAVSLFLGCATNTLDNATIQASIFVLNHLGIDVHIPRQQTCCGSIARQMGDADEAQQLINLDHKVFNEKLPIISLASGCGAGLNDYLPQHQVQDISAFLMTCDWSAINITPLPTRIFVHDPCTLRNVQKSASAVTTLLQKIPEADIQALPGNSQCCGGAGTYMLTQVEMAGKLLEDKMTALKSNQVTLLATSNIGCSLHLQQGIQSQPLTVKIEHPVHIIAKQMGFLGSN